MSQTNLKMFATSLATYARKEMKTVPRGSLLIRMMGENTVIGGIFGNANYLASEKARQEVGVLRQRLKTAGVEILQFGLSLDGYSWALLVRVNDNRFQTESGKAMQRELIKGLIDQVVEEVYRELYGTPLVEPE
jgi:hypothetical protein